MNVAEIESDGLADARNVLRRMPRGSIEYLRDVCLRQDTQGLDGHRFDCCGFGNLSKGVGYDYFGLTNDQVIKQVIEFAAMFGLQLDPRVQTPFEKFCMNMSPRKFNQLARVCVEVLSERGGIEPDHVLELEFMGAT